MRRNVISTCLLIVFISCGSVHAQEVVWSDEFDGEQIDSSVWTYDVGGWGFGNGQLEHDTARRENSYIENGNLVIEARRESYQGNAFTSARMLTQGRFAFKYGTLEARIKLPDTANGLWPAFWMLGNNFPAVEWPKCGEIDILEMGGKNGIAEGLQQRKINSAIHFAGADGNYGMADAWMDADVDLNLDYHLYKLSWTPQHVKCYLDDVEFGSWDITPDFLAEYHQPCFLILNLAVGGRKSSYTGIDSPEAVTASFPAKMQVDWIRLTSNPDTELFLGEDFEESGFLMSTQQLRDARPVRAGHPSGFESASKKFGVFTETTPVNNSLTFTDDSEPEFEYGDSAALYVWNNMTASSAPQTCSEGNECWSYDIAANDWFGMGVFVPRFRNMKNYSDGLLHFDVKTTSNTPMKVGIKSSRGGESSLPLGDETAELGFARDGEWHSVAIPLNRFANIDFQTVHQMFMISGDAPFEAINLSIDNVWWEPSGTRPTPPPGTFGVYTETASNKEAGEFSLGADGDFFIWEKTLLESSQSPCEGNESISLQSAPGLNWFGAAFTPIVKYDLSVYQGTDSCLCFSMKSTSSATFMIGMKSGNVEGIGQKWITFAPGADPYSFARDGEWYEIEIPMSEIASEVDLSEVSQLFQVLGLEGTVSNIEFDDIHFAVSAKSD